MGWEVHMKTVLRRGWRLTHAATIKADRRVWQAPVSTYLRPEPRACHPRPKAKSRMLKPARGAPAAAARRTGAIPRSAPPRSSRTGNGSG